MRSSPLEVVALVSAALAACGAAYAAGRSRGRRPGGDVTGQDPGGRSPAAGGGLDRTLLDALHDAIYAVSPDRRILTWNAAAERIYGFRPEEVIGRRVDEALRTHFSTGETHPQVFAELDRTGHLRRDVRQVRRDGAAADLEGHAVAVRDAGGAISGYVIVNRDITERKRAEEALRAGEAKFRAAFHGAGIAIALLDERGRVIEHNRPFANLVGYDDEELRDRPIAELLHPDDVPSARADLRQAVEHGRDLVIGERRYIRKDGACVHALLRSTIVRDSSGRFLHSVGVIEDVTQKKAIEAQLASADRIASLGTLAAGVAHEINNPLAFILSNLEYAAAELTRAGTATSDVLRALADTRDGALRVREIVRDLKTFSRSDDSPDDVLDLRQAVQSSLNLTQNEIRHRARLVVRMGETPFVRANPHRLAQVFVNLLINAVQAIAEGEPQRQVIEVTTATAADGRALVTVRDSGSGIPPENVSRIFEPFFTTKPVGIGTGLGLSICHGLVARMGGTIRVESRVGEGSTFSVLLPAAPAAAGRSAQAPRADAGAVRGRARLLVVDDEPMIGNAVARALRPDHEVVPVSSARAALEQIRGGPFDAILCDLMMPEMTGMELHAQLARSHPALASRMIFLTGGAFTPRAREFLDGVPNARLEKPFDTDALRALVRQVVSA